jgi:hypothetical protein
MTLPPKRRRRLPRGWTEGLEDLPRDSAHEAPGRRKRKNHAPIIVTDDWPELVPIGDDELRIIEGHMERELDELFGPLP